MRMMKGGTPVGARGGGLRFLAMMAAWAARPRVVAVLGALGALGAVVALPQPVRAQSADLAGVVRDSLTSETLPSALVRVDGLGYEIETDRFGRFNLVGLPAGPVRLTIEHLGYLPLELEVDPSQGDILNVVLVPDAIEVAGVTVRAQTQIVQAGREISQVTLSPAEIVTLPSLGEADVFRSLQLLPGVSATNDATSGLFIRGGTPDENLVLLDGMTVYHVDHFFGVFSAFNADAIKDIRLFKGGYPARFGGRTSSVVEMIGKSGDAQDYRVSAGLNLLSGRTVFEAPIFGRGSLLISARRSYTDVIQSGLFNNIFGTLQGADTAATTTTQQGGGGRGGRGRFVQQQTTPSFYFYDVNAKLTYSPTDRDVVALSLYGGQDNLDQSQAGQTLNVFPGANNGGNALTTPDRLDLTDWGNKGASGRWFRQWGSRFTSDALVAYSEYFSNSNQTVSGGPVTRGFLEENRVQDFTFRLDNTFQPARWSKVQFGGALTQSDVSYLFSRQAADTLAGSLDLGGESRQLSVYAQHQWVPSDRFDVTAGVRATDYNGTGRTYWEPRTSARFRITDQVQLKAAWGDYHQFVKRIENEDILEGSRDFWVLTDSMLVPSSAEHRIVGASYESETFLVDVEAYQKVLDGVSQFSTRSRQRPGQELEQLFFEGDGEARGIELLVQKKRGPLTGWVSYTLSEVNYQLDGFNDGLAFPASQDQTHELKVVGSYQVGAWTLAGTWVYGSGRPLTAPESRYTVELLDGTEFSYIHVGEKNSQRLPAYHRLDVAATRRFETARLWYDVNLSLFNAYGRANVWYRRFDLSQDPMIITDVTTLAFTPSIGLRFGLR